MDSVFSELEWALADYKMQERKQWRQDRFKEWFLKEFQQDHPSLLTIPEAQELCEPAFNFAIREHLIGKGVFIIERDGRPGRSRM
jgi:hypothetical protein